MFLFFIAGPLESGIWGSQGVTDDSNGNLGSKSSLPLIFLFHNSNIILQYKNHKYHSVHLEFWNEISYLSEAYSNSW